MLAVITTLLMHNILIVTALVNRSIMRGGPTKRGAVCITSYGMVSANPDLFSDDAGRKQWDYVILDEGHKVLYTVLHNATLYLNQYAIRYTAALLRMHAATVSSAHCVTISGRQ
jgi:hypothetical protein